MVQPIKRRAQSNALPIRPTHNPSPEDMVRVALAAITQTQACLLGPAQVIACLRAALDIYELNAKDTGFGDPDTLAKCHALGSEIAKATIESGSIRARKARPTGLVGVDGQEIHSTVEETASEVVAG